MASDDNQEDRTQSFTALIAGTTVSHYKIVEKIGSGGMGEVYLAEDTKLGRRVALKFLPSYLCQDDECRARFKREAQAAAQLDHANIVPVYEVGDYQGRPFFAMAAIEGQSLKELMSAAEMSIEQVLEVGIQICEGLKAAHDKGITHRDIKPSNVLLDSHGRARIVDFGLASLSGSEHLTKTGSTLGTIGYMSPEQVEGKEVDSRSDLFSLGVILYELIAKQNPFRRDSEAATLKAVSDDTPHPLARYRSGVPNGLQAILDKALDKDVKTRYQHADDLQVDLRKLKRDSDSGLLKKTEQQKTRKALVSSPAFNLSLIVLAIVLAFVSLKLLWTEQPRYVQSSHQQLTFSGKIAKLAISPDGKTIAYSAWDSESIENPTQELFVQDIAGGRPISIFKAQFFSSCRWSPDGSELLFTEVTDSVKKGSHIVPRLGGTSRDFRYFVFACWSPDGDRVAGCTFNPSSIAILNIASGEITRIALTVDFNWLSNLDWSPTDERLLFQAVRQGQSSIWTVGTDGNAQNLVLVDSSTISCPRWSPKGNEIYYLIERGHTRDLMKIGVSSSKGTAATKATIVQSGLQCGGEFSLSGDGKRMIYTRQQTSSNLWSATCEGNVVNMQIKTHQLTEGTSMAFSPSVSPDGRHVAFSMGDFDRTNIYIMPIEGGQMQQLTFLDGFCDCPSWSPDGEEIAFASNHDGYPRVWRVNSSGGPARPFVNTEVSFERRPDLTWYPCEYILYLRPGNTNFHLLDPDTEEEFPLLTNDSLGWIFEPVCSPDAERIAVYWNRKESGASIWVFSLENSLQTSLNTRHLHVIGWLSENDRVCVSETGIGTNLQRGYSPVIMAIPSTGGELEPYLTLPFEKIYGKISMTPDGRTFAFLIAESQSDIWLMGDFDPEVW